MIPDSPKRFTIQTSIADKMVLDLIDYIVILVPSGIVILGYFLNAFLQRRLQRVTTYHNVKLAAFKRINESVAGMILALVGLRNAFAVAQEAPSKERITSIAWQIGMAREAERPLGTDVAERTSEDLKAVSIEQDDEAMEKWAEATQFTLLSIYSRAFGYHHNAIETHSAEASMVSSTDEVESALDDFAKHAIKYSLYLTEQAGRGEPSPEQIEAEISPIAQSRRRLIDAMKRELRKPL